MGSQEEVKLAVELAALEATHAADVAAMEATYTTDVAGTLSAAAKRDEMDRAYNARVEKAELDQSQCGGNDW